MNPRTPRLLLLPLALLFGCDHTGPADVLDEVPDSTDLGYQLVEQDYPLIVGDDTICAVLRAESEDFVDERVESYVFSAMRSELENDDAWRAFSGFESLETCDDAREYAELRLAYEEQELEPELEPELVLHPEEPEFVGQEDDPRIAKVALADDTNADVDAVVRVWANVSSPGSSCSGTLINPRVVLTAAHCLGTDGPLSVSLRREEGGVVQSTVTRSANTRRHPNYGGAGDPGDDVGLVVFDQPIPGVDVHYDTMRVMTSTINVPDPIEFFGWGTTGHNGLGSGVQRSGIANINWASTRHIVDNLWSGAARVCAGDSGGPAILLKSHTGLTQDMVGGIASEFWNGSDFCPYDAGYQYWAAPSNKIPWIEARLLSFGIDFTTSSQTACHRFSQNGRNYMRCW